MATAGVSPSLFSRRDHGWFGVRKDDKDLAKTSLVYETKGCDLMIWTRPGKRLATVGR